jgi:hypothetical protein
MTSFDEDFPGLKLEYFDLPGEHVKPYVDPNAVMKHCFDRQKVLDAFRDFTRNEIDEMRKECPNFGYNEQHEELNTRLIRQINMVFEKRRKEFGPSKMEFTHATLGIPTVNEWIGCFI